MGDYFPTIYGTNGTIQVKEQKKGTTPNDYTGNIFFCSSV